MCEKGVTAPQGAAAAAKYRGEAVVGTLGNDGLGRSAPARAGERRRKPCSVSNVCQKARRRMHGCMDGCVGWPDAGSAAAVCLCREPGIGPRFLVHGCCAWPVLPGDSAYCDEPGGPCMQPPASAQRTQDAGEPLSSWTDGRAYLLSDTVHTITAERQDRDLARERMGLHPLPALRASVARSLAWSAHLRSRSILIRISSRSPDYAAHVPVSV